ncbi:unnamed protein product, partial [Ectocarpus sp. 12 AP-2014]
PVVLGCPGLLPSSCLVLPRPRRGAPPPLRWPFLPSLLSWRDDSGVATLLPGEVANSARSSCSPPPSSSLVAELELDDVETRGTGGCRGVRPVSRRRPLLS